MIQQILLKQPEGKTIGRGDRFAPNPRFTDRLKRIRVPLPPVDERKRVVEDVDKVRRRRWLFVLSLVRLVAFVVAFLALSRFLTNAKTTRRQPN
jgi:hypothetical protein